MHSQVYHSQDIRAWEQRWFAHQNSAYGLMQQAAWAITQRIISKLATQNNKNLKIAVCCGQGNNAGDGYLLAKYLASEDYDVEIYAADLGPSELLKRAHHEATQAGLNIYAGFEFAKKYDVYIDALFGIGLNRHLSDEWQTIIQNMNTKSGMKIAIDLPSGLHANTGKELPIAFKADYTLTILGQKIGLFTGQGKEYAGEVETISLIPQDGELKVLAQLSPTDIRLPKRQAFGHKGSYGHVLIVGGHAEMGGAVILAAEAAFSAGAGKVSIACHAKHHSAILSRAPNIMLRDIDALSLTDIKALLDQVDAVSFGMGLGRDAWAENIYLQWFNSINQLNLAVVLDADALWFLALNPTALKRKTYATPHPGEAAKLLGITIQEIESDRVLTIQCLKQKYQGEWVLKGAGSLILQDASSKERLSENAISESVGSADSLSENQLWLCISGNAGMATGGMGDILAGMIASLKAQFQDQIQLHQIVTLHGLAGDKLAKSGMRGVQAQHMIEAIHQVVNR